MRLTNMLIRSTEDCPNRQPMVTYKFKFPPDVTKTMKFNSYHDIKGYLLREQPTVGGRVSTMYRYNCEPKIQNCTNIRVRCNYCIARMSFKLEKGQFVVSRFNNQHCHLELAFDTKLQQHIFRYYRDISRKEWGKKRVKREIRMTGEGVDTQLHFMNRELLNENEKYNNWELLSKELRGKDYEWKVDWGSEPYGPYPRMMVLVSKPMRQNYRSYGELLSFDLTYNLIKNMTFEGRRYGLGVFCVTDTNVRILMAGLAIMCEQRKEDMYKMFKFFFELHGGNFPQTIITDQQKTMELGLDMLAQSDRFSGIHIYDPFHIVNHIRESVRGEEDAMRESVRLISRMIRCRGLLEYQECSNQLAKDVENAPLFADFMSKAHKVCHFQIPRSFLGINRFTCEVVNDLIKVEVPYEISINRLMERLIELDHRLRLKSTEGFDIFAQPIELQFGDERVKEVRMTFEKKVFSRFMENYIKGLSEYELVQTFTRNGEVLFQLKCFNTNELFEVEKWACQCDELVKTGVPCPHLIVCARSCPDRPYVELFNPRWKKKVPVLSTDEIVWTKKKFMRCERYYIPKRNRLAKVYYAVVTDQESPDQEEDSEVDE